MQKPKASRSGLKRRLSKVVVTVAVLAAIVSQITWNDYVTLGDGSHVRVLARDGDTLLLQRSSDTSTLRLTTDARIQFAPGIRTLLHEARVPWLCLALGLQAITQVLLLARWKLLLRSAGERESLANLTVWQCRAHVFGLTVFGQFGSDVIRVQQSITGGHNPAVSAGVIIVERLIGLIVLVGLAVLGGVCLGGQASASLSLWLVYGILGILCVALLILLPPLLGWITTCQARNRLAAGIVNLARDGHAAFERLLARPWQIVAVSALTLGIHLSVVAPFAAVDHAFSCGNSWPLYLAVVPLVNLAACIPTFNGLIVFEGSAILLLNQLGQVPPTTGLIICTAVRFFDLSSRLVQATLIWIGPHAASNAHRDLAVERVRAMRQPHCQADGATRMPATIAE